MLSRWLVPQVLILGPLPTLYIQKMSDCHLCWQIHTDTHNTKNKGWPGQRLPHWQWRWGPGCQWYHCPSSTAGTGGTPHPDTPDQTGLSACRTCTAHKYKPQTFGTVYTLLRGACLLICQLVQLHGVDPKITQRRGKTNSINFRQWNPV